MAVYTRWWRYMEQQRMRLGIKGPTAFATHLGIPRTKLTTWQQGTIPGTDSIGDIARRLDIPVETLLIEAELFTAEDFGLTHLPADARTLSNDALLEELRRRLPGGEGDDNPAGPGRSVGEPFRGARRGQRPVDPGESRVAADPGPDGAAS